MEATCCPQYTIKCDSTNFSLNQSHKKVLKKMINFLTKENTNQAKNSGPTDRNTAINPIPVVFASSSSTPPIKFKEVSEPEKIRIQQQKKTEGIFEEPTSDKPAIANTLNVESQLACKTPQKKAKILRLERRLNKQKSKPETSVLPAPKSSPATESLPKNLEDLILEGFSSSVHHLEIKLVNSSSSEFKDSLQETHKLYTKYQMAIHQDTEDECTLEQFKRFLVKTPLQVLFNLT